MGGGEGGLPTSRVQPPRFTLFVHLLGVDYVAGSHCSLRPMRRQICRVEHLCLKLLFCSCYWDKRVAYGELLVSSFGANRLEGFVLCRYNVGQCISLG